MFHLPEKVFYKKDTKTHIESVHGGKISLFMLNSKVSKISFVKKDTLLLFMKGRKLQCPFCDKKCHNKTFMEIQVASIHEGTKPLNAIFVKESF